MKKLALLSVVNARGWCTPLSSALAMFVTTKINYKVTL